MVNVGRADRFVRALLGLVLIAVPFTPLLEAAGAWKYAMAAAGVVLMGTAMLRCCPLYAVFGMSTCPLERR